MNGKERGFLLLTSSLGDPERRPLSAAQFRTLTKRILQQTPIDEDRDLTEWDLKKLGYDSVSAGRIISLLREEERLDWYLNRGKRWGCVPVSRISPEYPLAIRKRIGLDAPGCLWVKGNRDLLQEKAVALVGSRDLKKANRTFAQCVGREAARQGVVLVSGNARGADRTAQEACLAHGGKVICVVADELQNYPDHDRILYLSEDSFDLPFTAQRALSRNRVIHAMGAMTIVAQCSFHTGGTWDGTVKNLTHIWSPVYCFDDGTAAMTELVQMGAEPIALEQLADFCALSAEVQTFI